tara:strand:- start:9 stop:329 length:321 start_codon:yes stop_codon:yes gene_type:complete
MIDYSFNNLDDIDWLEIKKLYPLSFLEYMKHPDLESFMVACNCTIAVNYILDKTDDWGCWETRVEAKNQAIRVIGMHTFGETKVKTMYRLFELIEKQMENERFERN